MAKRKQLWMEELPRAMIALHCVCDDNNLAVDSQGSVRKRQSWTVEKRKMCYRLRPGGKQERCRLLLVPASQRGISYVYELPEAFDTPPSTLTAIIYFLLCFFCFLAGGGEERDELLPSDSSVIVSASILLTISSTQPGGRVHPSQA